MIIGFTGTQHNTTLAQFECLFDMVVQTEATEAHHGDCVGADASFHAMCEDVGIPIVIHPPLVRTKRAFCEEGVVVEWPAKDYLVRNHDIVDCIDLLLVCPKTFEEQLRSGTWATWRYAKKQGKDIILILPEGKIQCDSP